MAKIKSGFPGERAIVIPAGIIQEFKNNELGRLLHITDIGFYPKAGYHYRSRPAGEALQYILLYCVDGVGIVQIAGNRHVLSSGDLIVLPKGIQHKYESDTKNPWSIYWIHFDGEMAAYFSDGLDKPISIIVEKDSRINDRLELFEDIFSILKNGYSKINLDYSVTVFFHFLGSLKFIHAYRKSLSERQSHQDLIESAIHFMRENIHRQIRLNETAKFTGMSVSHFSLIFKQKTGFAPLNYFNHLRIQSACHQLDFSDLQINQIAMKTGFEDPFYFSRLFSKIMGSSPAEYRKRKKG